MRIPHVYQRGWLPLSPIVSAVLAAGETSGPHRGSRTDMVGPGAQELSAMNAIQHGRLGEAKVFTRPRRPPGITPRR